jgi:hypothetical protein
VEMVVKNEEKNLKNFFITKFFNESAVSKGALASSKSALCFNDVFVNRQLF